MSNEVSHDSQAQHEVVLIMMSGHDTVLETEIAGDVHDRSTAFLPCFVFSDDGYGTARYTVVLQIVTKSPFSSFPWNVQANQRGDLLLLLPFDVMYCKFKSWDGTRWNLRPRCFPVEP